ncbi:MULTISPECIES: hypothetical protein [unclassified Ensifer]|uniref:hypothetical protein n=1 Tax=unclassified Ensifer TaxID=2633371 RepID=UPI000812DF6E|nr:MULTISPECIES: hypothetical protein [unclassified Ensifer]OCP01853.1 hypothetical protein BC362_21385 [Ensifer sp. LC14]OCP09729.1 hypothetical protein BC374_03125 [Ensifer sp. LC13]OCP10733.1 hypothetical protein BBX50_03470 [Ensifer sp. LC11]OCP32906.1 hypothetical protein BC364_03125 [Ensifer sp. LC499]
MRRMAYEIGDKVKLKASATQSALNSPFGRIAGRLPTDRGEARYRVRVEGETFERCVLESDLEHTEIAAQGTAQADPTGPWLKPLSTRPGK